MAREIWKPVKGYEGLYEVSDQGRVRSLRRSGTPGRVLTQRQSKGKIYLLVRLSRNNQRKIKTVHSLVLAAFVGPRPAGETRQDGCRPHTTVWCHEADVAVVTADLDRAALLVVTDPNVWSEDQVVVHDVIAHACVHNTPRSAR